MSDERLSVVVVDDHEMVRRGLVSFLSVLPDIHAIGEAGDGDAALRLVDRLVSEGTPPDVVLLDLMMPRRDGVETARELAKRHPGIHTVILTGFDDLERVHSVLALGTSGYLMKDATPAEVEAAIRAAAAGELFLDPAVAGRVTRRMYAADGLGALSDRERDVLALVAEGLSNRQIGERLHISERTARTHVSNLLGKLGVTSRTQAALLAVREGFGTT